MAHWRIHTLLFCCQSQYVSLLSEAASLFMQKCYEKQKFDSRAESVVHGSTVSITTPPTHTDALGEFLISCTSLGSMEPCLTRRCYDHTRLQAGKLHLSFLFCSKLITINCRQQALDLGLVPKVDFMYKLGDDRSYHANMNLHLFGGLVRRCLGDKKSPKNLGLLIGSHHEQPISCFFCFVLTLQSYHITFPTCCLLIGLGWCTVHISLIIWNNLPQPINCTT